MLVKLVLGWEIWWVGADMANIVVFRIPDVLLLGLMRRVRSFATGATVNPRWHFGLVRRSY